MTKNLIDADALIGMFENATAKQGEQIRKAVSEATLRALQARELTLKNIRGTLKAVTDAAGTGAAKNLGAGVDVSELLDKAVAGMDDALLRAVDANRTALASLVAQGADLRESHLKKALEEVERIEDTLMGVLRKAAEGAAQGVDSTVGKAMGTGMGANLAAAWAPVLDKLNAAGTLSGASAASTVEQLMGQMHSTMKQSRAASLKAVQALASSYTAMVSGVLIGMSDALKGPPATPDVPRRTNRKQGDQR